MEDKSFRDEKENIELDKEFNPIKKVKKKKKDNRNLKYTIIAALFAIIGVLLLALPYINDMIINHYASKIDVTTIDVNKLKENLRNTEASFDFSNVTNISATEAWTEINSYNEDLIIGRLVVPSLNMNLALFRGLDGPSLLAGVGTMKADQEFGKGNFSIAGHRAKSKDVLFHSLMYAEMDKTIRLSDNDKIYIYRIKDIRQTDPDALYMIEDSRMKDFGNKPIISLMTCYYGQSDSRYFVTGVLEKIIDYSEEALLDNKE